MSCSVTFGFKIPEDCNHGMMDSSRPFSRPVSLLSKALTQPDGEHMDHIFYDHHNAYSDDEEEHSEDDASFETDSDSNSSFSSSSQPIPIPHSRVGRVFALARWQLQLKAQQQQQECQQQHPQQQHGGHCQAPALDSSATMQRS